MVSDILFTSEYLKANLFLSALKIYLFIHLYIFFIQLLLKMCFIAMFTCFDLDLHLYM